MSTNQSLDRGLALLDLVDKSDAPMGVRELARELRISAAIVQRLVNTLAKHRYLEQTEETRRYRLGPRALGLGHSLVANDQLLSAANAVLQRLARDRAINCFLGALRDRRAVYLIAVQSSGPISIRATPGSLAHLHSTAMGKVLLASLDEAAASQIFKAGPLAKLTPRTVTDPAALLRELKAVRTRGYATAVEENLTGVISIGCPVRDESGRVLAAISGAFARSTSPNLTISAVAPVMMAAAAEISTALGYVDTMPRRRRAVA